MCRAFNYVKYFYLFFYVRSFNTVNLYIESIQNYKWTVLNMLNMLLLTRIIQVRALVFLKLYNVKKNISLNDIHEI